MKPLVFILLAFWLLAASHAHSAQAPQSAPGTTNQPLIKSSLLPENVVPGQTISLRVTVYVPTWLTKPIVFPEFDQPNLDINLPDRATTAVSKDINGQTWSGVSREYQIIPLAPGDYRLPKLDFDVTYRNPDGSGNLQQTLEFSPPTVRVNTPKGAEDLKPFIAARELALEQKIDGEPENLHAGDSFSRTVTATINGSTVMFIPALLNTDSPDGIAAYGDEPKATDSAEFRSDDTTGVRTERVTYVAEAGARGTLPAVTLRWYDLDDGKIKTTSVDAVKVHARGSSTLMSGNIWEKLLMLCAAAVALWLLAKWARPKLHRFRQQRRRRNEASGKNARQKLRTACAARDYPALLQAASELQQREPSAATSLHEPLLALGHARFGNTPASASAAPLWQQMARAVEALPAESADTQPADLPPLNPSNRWAHHKA